MLSTSPHVDLNGATLWLQLHVDGLSLRHSSQFQLWPIMGRVVKPFHTTPFIIGIYSGLEKPSSVQGYLMDLLEDLQDAIKDGIRLSDATVRLYISAIICDKPARAFLQQGMSHTGYGGCDKCIQRGRYSKHRMTFPSLRSRLRTNLDFRKSNRRHKSPLESLPIDMINTFPVDYMHAVCLGVVRRLLNLLSSADLSLTSRLTPEQTNRINDRMRTFYRCLPVDFPRKCRDLNHWRHWKASECRQFLLYLGPAALNGILDDEKYVNFLDLSLAVYILCHPREYNKHMQFTSSLMEAFISNFSSLYGSSQVVYNVHVLTHLVECCRRHGPLDTLSAFPL